jgi:hypothetical protein
LSARLGGAGASNRAGGIMHLNVNVAILSLFCAGGVFAYAREALRLHRLMSEGRLALARIVKMRMDDGGESVVHYLVTYEFTDDQGKTVIREQDLNSREFFCNLAIGETIEVLYRTDRTGVSCPVNQIRSDQRISCYITAAILLFWAGMAVFFLWPE